jgi:hypothetical protein
MSAVRISNWYTRRPKYADPYQAPELVGLSVAGEVHGHRKKRDGERVTTSRIVRIDGRKFWTESGTEYLLEGEPLPAFLEHLKTIGREYNPEQPIAVIGVKP